MEAWRSYIAVALAGLMLAAPLVGCRTADSAPKDPFALKPAGAAAARNSAGAPMLGRKTEPKVDAQPPGTAAPGQEVAQASYDAAAAPGSSLKDADLDEPKVSMWDRLNRKASSEEIKKSYKSMVGRGPDEAIARKAYNEGDRLFREGKFEEAADQFEVAVDRWPDSLLEEDALYMLGESYFFADRYYKSRNTFDQLIAKYENSRHLDRVTSRMFAIGRFWDEKGRDHWLLTPNFTDHTRPWFDTHGNGIKAYETIRLNDPTGPLADDAVMAHGTAMFVDERFEEASYQYEILRKDYPQSDHQKQAHLLGLQSYMNAYQGPQYDRTPIDKASKLVDSTIRNLGHQMPEEHSRLQQAREAIRAQQAEREYDLGEYYRRLDYNAAARQHYANVLRDYPDTRFAELAQQRTLETQSLPDAPPDHFPWLTKWLGKD